MRCKVARKPPKRSFKPVPRHGRMHCKVTGRPPEAAEGRLRKQLQSCSKSARMRCKSGTSRRKGGSTQVLCRYLAGLFLCLRPRLSIVFLFSSFHFLDLKLRLGGPKMCFFVNLNLETFFEAGAVYCRG